MGGVGGGGVVKLIFCIKVNTKDFNKLLVSLLRSQANKFTMIIQNNKFTISLQYLKENLKNELELLPKDKGLFKLLLSL